MADAALPVTPEDQKLRQQFEDEDTQAQSHLWGIEESLPE
jgi:hypothetical protein